MVDDTAQSLIERNRFLLPAIFLALAVLYILPFLINIENWGLRDWDRSFVMAAIPGDAFFHYGQFPFWNPYMGGGNIFFHHPEVAVLTPFLLLSLIFGPVVGLKLQILVCFFIGLWGSYRFARALTLSSAASLLVSIAYFGSVYFALHFAEGHAVFTEFCLLPWFLTCIVRASSDRRNLVWGMVLVGFVILGSGGGAVLLYTILFSFSFFILYSLHARSSKPFLHMLIGFAGGIAISAVKFVPMIVHLMHVAPPDGPRETAIPFSALAGIFFGFDQSLITRAFPEQFWSWPEYGAYLSPLLIVLALVAVLVAFRRIWYWALILLFFLLLGMGDIGVFSPWHLLTALPGLEYTRCSARAFQFVLLAFAIMGGIGFDFLLSRSSSSRHAILRVAAWAAAILVCATNLILAWPIMRSAFPDPPEPTHYSPAFRNVANDTTRVLYRNFLENKGSLRTQVTLYKEFRTLMDFKDSSVVSDAVMEGSAKRLGRTITPSRVEYEIDATTSGKFAVSVGYDPGWRIEDGRPVEDFLGVLAFPFSPGRQTIVLRYLPPYFYLGLAISLVSMIGLALLLRRLKPSHLH